MTRQFHTAFRSLRLPDIAMGVGMALTWGLDIVFSKVVITHFPPVLLMGFRFTVTALVLVCFV